MRNKKFWLSLTAVALLAAIFIGFAADLQPHVNAATSSEIKDQIEQMEKEFADYDSQLAELENKKNANVTEIRDMMEQKYVLDQQVGVLYTQINNLNQQIAAYALLIADKQEEVEKAQQRLHELNMKNKERIRAMEERGSLSYWEVLFEASSFTDLLDRLNMVQEIAAADKRRLDEMSAMAKEVEEAKRLLEQEQQELEDARADLNQKQADVEAALEEMQKLITALLAKGEEFEAYMMELEDEQSKLHEEIEKQKEAYDKASYSEWLATSVPPTTKPPATSGGGVGGSAVDKDGLTWFVPCDYSRVTSPFGWRIHPISGDYKFHAGVDLSKDGIMNAPIYATRSGVVVFAGWYGGGGWTVIIDHADGYESYYMHMNYISQGQMMVKPGDFVAAGQQIGHVGTSGGSTGAHLHFEVRFNGEAINPMSLIK